jgi:hypothetical protein
VSGVDIEKDRAERVRRVRREVLKVMEDTESCMTCFFRACSRETREWGCLLHPEWDGEWECFKCGQYEREELD